MNTVSVNVREILSLVVVSYITALFVVPTVFLGFVGFGSLLTFLTDCCVLPASIKPMITPLAGALVAGSPPILYGAGRKFR